MSKSQFLTSTGDSFIRLTLQKTAYSLDTCWVALRVGVCIIAKPAVLSVARHQEIRRSRIIWALPFDDEGGQIATYVSKSIFTLEAQSTYIPAEISRHLLSVLFGTKRQSTTSVGKTMVSRGTLLPNPS